MPSPETQCIVFLTHQWSDALSRHYRRLKQQAGAVMPVYLVYQQPDDATGIPDGMYPDIVVRTEDYFRRFPVRATQAMGQPLHVTGHLDLIWMTAFENAALAQFEHLWMIESDVDFSGDWSNFFRDAAHYDGDVLGARMRHVSQSKRFYFTDTLRQPAGGLKDPLLGFFPIARLSRRAIDAYVEAIANPEWAGYFEILMPTVMMWADMTIADIGGNGPFTPASRIGKHYQGRFDSNSNDGSTHRFRPVLGFHFYVDRPWAFPRRNCIYHPVKTELSKAQRAVERERRMRKWWLRERNAALGRRVRHKGFIE